MRTKCQFELYLINCLNKTNTESKGTQKWRFEFQLIDWIEQMQNKKLGMEPNTTFELCLIDWNEQNTETIMGERPSGGIHI